MLTSSVTKLPEILPLNFCHFFPLIAGGVVVRLYALFFCAVVCLSELELTSGIKDSVLVKSWIGRGVFYVL